MARMNKDLEMTGPGAGGYKDGAGYSMNDKRDYEVEE